MTIPAPRNALVSYHYFKDYDLDRLAGLRLIGDSGAFSAATQGATITVEDLVRWARQWRHRLCWVAALDVIGDPDATRRNWHRMVDVHGIDAVPTLHYGSPPQAMDYYAARGVDFMGLGGAVGRPAPTQMRWLVQMFKYARDRHPDMRFHGWGMTHRDITALPFFSVDSSGWGGGYRYGRLTLRDPNSHTDHGLQLDGRSVYTPAVARLLRDHYDVTPAQVSTSGPHNRLLMVKLSALSASVQEQRFRYLHRRQLVTAPSWGQLAVPAGPHQHLALNNKGQEYEVDAIRELAGPHLHLAEGSEEHLRVVAGLNRD